jgi:hypothetical protein
MIVKHELEKALREVIEEDTEPETAIPTTQQLLSYAEGSLPNDLEPFVRKYLLNHPDVTRVLYSELPDRREAETLLRLAPEELEGSLKRLQAHIAAETRIEPMRQPLGDVSTSQLPRRPFSIAALIASLPTFHQGWRIAAGLATVACFLLGGLLWRSESEVARLARRAMEPQTHIAHRLLLPDGQRGSGAQMAIPLPARHDPWLLEFALLHQPLYSNYRLDLFSGSARIWTTTGLVVGAGDSIELWMPDDFLKLGEYRFELFGLQEGKAARLATYTIVRQPL